MWLRCVFVVLAALVAACAASPTSTTSTGVIAQPTEATTTVAPTTSTMAESTSSLVPDRVMPERFNPVGGGGDFRTLSEGTVWVMPLDGVTIELAPAVPGWVLLGLSTSRAVFGWNGPAGQGTLEALVYDVGFDGADEAWTRIEALGDRLEEDLDWEWTWIDRGTGLVGDRRAEWREVRIPPVPVEDDGILSWDAIPVVQAPFPVVLGHDSTARFYVVPIDDEVTVTVLGWESRCICPPDGLFFRYFVDEDVENELSMWIDDLEVFLSGLDIIDQGGA